jgi:hypothetical protein
MAPKGEAEELAKLPNPEDLNLSSLVWGRSSGVFSAVVVDLGGFDRAEKGEEAEKLAKPLLGGI